MRPLKQGPLFVGKMQIDFQNPEQLKVVSIAISKAVDAAIEADNTEGYRSHLGASVIGNECLRYLFYHFRWMHRETFTGQTLRLFQVGHGLETRVRRWLTAIGFEFIDGLDATQTQVRFSAIMGHFGGSVDGIFIAPPWGITEPTLLECKTSQTGSAFNDLAKKRMRVAKEQHFIQNSVYGKGLGLRNVLYVCEDKNDSEWYFELLALDESTADGAYKKAEFVILEATTPPKKISNKRNFFKCNMCTMQGICHDGLTTDINCRSCVNSRPVEDGQWKCEHWGQVIPKDAILNACPAHRPIQ
jgi:hypothetical protein